MSDLEEVVFAKYRHILSALADLLEQETFDTLFQAVEQLQVENEQLKKALKANIQYCEYFDGEKRCGEIARWGVFDHDGWREYYCDKHKGKKTSREKPKRLENNIMAEQALKESEGKDAKANR